MRNWGVRVSTFRTTLKPLLKKLKDKVFVSFNMEFKLKYYRKSTKTNNLLLIFWDGTRLRVLLFKKKYKLFAKKCSSYRLIWNLRKFKNMDCKTSENRLKPS